jgi:tetratricopeptide (TPR) repeat protein
MYYALVVVLLSPALFGCTTVSRPVPNGGVVPPEGDSQSVDVYQRLAKRYETNRQLSKALLMWRVIASLSPNDAMAEEKIVYLKKTIESQSSAHFTKGTEYLKQKSIQAARREFILALAYNPNLTEASDHVRRLSSEEEFVEYEVQPGDSPERIAQRVYRDAGKHPIVAYFGGMLQGDELRSGRILRLPAPDLETKGKVVSASKSYQRENAATRVYDKAGAELRYSKGVSFYLEEQFQEAIKEWEEALRLDPEHPNAKRDIQKARTMLKKAGLK